MKKILHIVFAMIILLPWAGSAEIQKVTDGNAKVKVGVILPLSGEGATIGDGIKNGIAMGLTELSPKTRNKIEVVYEDDALLPKNTVTAFNRLVGIHNVDVVINVSSGTSNAIAPLAEQKKIPFIAIASDQRIVRSRNYGVNLWVTPETEVGVMLDELHRLGYKKIARISTIHDWPIVTREIFDRENKGEISVVLDEEYAGDVKDFKMFITKLRMLKNIDGIVVTLMPGQCGVFAKQLKEGGVKIPIIGFEMFEDSGEVKSSQGALVGATYVNAADGDDHFIKEFKERYPNSSMLAAANGHDAILLIGRAIEHDTSREGINGFLHTVKNFSGALGTFSASGDNRFTLQAAVKVVKEDGFETVRR